MPWIADVWNCSSRLGRHESLLIGQLIHRTDTLSRALIHDQLTTLNIPGCRVDRSIPLAGQHNPWNFDLLPKQAAQRVVSMTNI